MFRLHYLDTRTGNREYFGHFLSAIEARLTAVRLNLTQPEIVPV